MSLAIPLFADLSKAARTVLYGDTAGEGAFLASAGGGAKLMANTVTADGVSLLLGTSISSGGTVTPSFTAMFSPSKDLMLMGILGAGGAVTGAVTLSNLAGVSGLQATLTATPPVINSSSSNALTLDCTTVGARLRAVVTPAAGRLLLSQGAKAELSGTTSVGPCVLGARVAGDSAGRVSQWSLGANWTRMTSHADGSNGAALSGGLAGIGTLDGQQVGVVLTDSCPGRSATVSLHQLLSGGATSLAAEYSLPLGGSSSTASEPPASLALGLAQRTANGGLFKVRLDQGGTLGLLYQTQLADGAGKLAISCSCDPLALRSKVPPSFGFAWTVA